MKKILVTLFIVINIVSYSQNFNEKDWVPFDANRVTTLTITKTENLKFKNFEFKIIWDKKLSYSNNIGYYGGIKSMKIFSNSKLINTYENIEDGVALGEIYLRLYDYNMDGNIDFTLPIDCGKSCYQTYYLFNPKLQKFENNKDWDYLRIQKMNHKTKQILGEPDGTCCDGDQKLYKVVGSKLIKQKTFYY